MSETDVERLMKKVDIISEVVIRIDQRLVGYEDLKKTVDSHTMDVDKIRTNCDSIQKRKIRINLSVMFTQIIIGAILAIIGYFIGKGGV